MSWVAVAVVGANLYSSYKQNQAAGDAAAAQSAAAQQGIGVQQQQFAQLQQNLSPYMQAGGAALQAYRDLLGIGGTPLLAAQETAAAAPPPPQYGGRTPGLGSWITQAGGAPNQAAPIVGTPTGQQYQSAQSAQAQAIANLSNSPQMQAMLQQGENAMLQNAAATGGIRGGNTQAALAQFRPQLLNQMIQQQLGQLGGLAGMGQSSAAGVGNAGMGMAGNIGNLLAQQGAAQAGGALGQANAWTSGVQNTLGGLAAMKSMKLF